MLGTLFQVAVAGLVVGFTIAIVVDLAMSIWEA